MTIHTPRIAFEAIDDIHHAPAVGGIARSARLDVPPALATAGLAKCASENAKRVPTLPGTIAERNAAFRWALSFELAIAERQGVAVDRRTEEALLAILFALDPRRSGNPLPALGDLRVAVASRLKRHIRAEKAETGRNPRGRPVAKGKTEVSQRYLRGHIKIGIELGVLRVCDESPAGITIDFVGLLGRVTRSPIWRWHVHPKPASEAREIGSEQANKCVREPAGFDPHLFALRAGRKARQSAEKSRQSMRFRRPCLKTHSPPDSSNNSADPHAAARSSSGLQEEGSNQHHEGLNAPHNAPQRERVESRPRRTKPGGPGGGLAARIVPAGAVPVRAAREWPHYPLDRPEAATVTPADDAARRRGRRIAAGMERWVEDNIWALIKRFQIVPNARGQFELIDAQHGRERFRGTFETAEAAEDARLRKLIELAPALIPLTDLEALYTEAT